MDIWNRRLLAAILVTALLGACSEDRTTSEQPAPTPAGMNTDREQEDLEVTPSDRNIDDTQTP